MKTKSHYIRKDGNRYRKQAKFYLVMGVSGRFPDGEQHEQSHGETGERSDDEHPPPAQRLCVQDKAEPKGHAVAEIDAPVVETQCSTTELLQQQKPPVEPPNPDTSRMKESVLACKKLLLGKEQVSWVIRNCYGGKKCPHY